jgi:RHS repeat-associated protein
MGFKDKKKMMKLQGEGNSYDFEARMLDVRIGRWFARDPFATLFPSQSPYSTMNNNPIIFIDPDGRASGSPHDHYINTDGSIQTVKTNDNFDRFYVQNKSSETGYTLIGQLDKNSSGLVQFPISGAGIGRYGGSDTGGTSTSPSETVGNGDHYLKPIAAAALFGIVNKLDTEFGFNIDFGDMSSSNGSDPWQLGQKHHAGHGHNGKRSGSDVDFRYLNINGDSFQSDNAFNSSSFSPLNNQRVYDTAVTFGFTVNYQGLSGSLDGPSRIKNHNNHGHLGLSINNLNWTFVNTAPVLQKATSNTTTLFKPRMLEENMLIQVKDEIPKMNNNNLIERKYKSKKELLDI